MPRIIGYTYDADVYCVPCAVMAHVWVCNTTDCGVNASTNARLGWRMCTDCPMLDENGIPVEERDSEGNRVHPIFLTAVALPGPGYCGSCSVRVYGDGPDDDGPEDDYDQQDYCRCPDCVAAAAYTGEVA